MATAKKAAKKKAPLPTGTYVILKDGTYARYMNSRFYTVDPKVGVGLSSRYLGMSRQILSITREDVKRVITAAEFTRKYPKYKHVTAYDPVGGYRVRKVGNQFIFGCGAVKVGLKNATAYITTEEKVQAAVRRREAARRRADAEDREITKLSNNVVYRAIRQRIANESGTALMSVQNNIVAVRKNLLERA